MRCSNFVAMCNVGTRQMGSSRPETETINTFLWTSSQGIAGVMVTFTENKIKRKENFKTFSYLEVLVTVSESQ